LKQEKYTYCRICEANCGLIATVEDGKLAGVAGDPEHPISKGFICRRGKATFDVHHDPDRIKQPMKRDGAEFKPVSWEEAINDIGARLKAIREKHGRHGVGFYFGNPTAFDFPFSMYLTFALQTMATRNVFSSGSQDCNNKFVGSKKVYGSPIIHPVPDMEKVDFLIIIGSNPAVSQMSFISFARPVERLKKIIDRGGRVIFVDPRKTETIKQVGEHVQIKPDADVYFLSALLNVVINEDLYDKAFVAAHARGFDELKEFVSPWTPDKVAGVTGIKAGDIAKLARDFASAKNAGIHASVGLNLGSHGTIAYWLLQALLAVTGRLDKRGSMIFVENFINLPSMYKRRPSNASARRASRVGGYPPVMGTIPAGVMADEMLLEGEGRPRSMIVVCGNPMLSVPDPGRLKKAMAELELSVSLDFYINETGALCDYVLPCRDFYERWDLAITGMIFNPIHFINYAEAVVPAVGESKDTWIVLHDILKKAGYMIGGNPTANALVRGLDRLGPIIGAKEPTGFSPHFIMRIMLMMGGVSFKELRNNRQGVLLPDHRTGNFFDKRIVTEDKKVNLAPEDFIAHAGALGEFFEEEDGYDGFKLICQRQKVTHNSWFHNVPSMVEKDGTNRALINPEDAARLEVEDGEPVVVENESGSVEIPALVSDEVAPGVVAIPHGWGHDLDNRLTVAKKHPGVNVNELIAAGDGALEEFAGMAKMTGVKVKIRRA